MNETSALQREIRQTRPFRSRSQEAMLALLRTADQVHRSFARVVEPHGITLQQYNVLRILRGAGDAGLPTLEIGARMIERSPGVTRLIDRLEAKGWVRRERCPHDRRQVLCWITPAGGTLLGALDGPMDEADEQGLARLPEEDLRHLIRLLDAIREGSR
ncbi:MAG TPA: MarR family transcriptional regulator [Thermoanaerobaculia bacterium]|nr:MarR family transcriptional regulator [Thermoanaerobaculia bacterium]